MNLKARIDSSKELSNWASRIVDGLEYPNDDGHLLSAACLSVVMSHHASIVYLIERKHSYPTAFAIPRLMVDALVRGLWLIERNTSELEQYRREGTKKKLWELVEEIKGTPFHKLIYDLFIKKNWMEHQIEI